MHLAEILALRSRVGAGVFLALTRRCPLHCAHCSTRSTPDGEQGDDAPYRRLVESFSAEDRPEILALTGGEPTLRPALALDLVRRARASGTRSYLLTGAFFAVRDTWAPDIERVVREVDHLAVSLDRFHELEVPRERIFALLERRLAWGAASLQVVVDEAEVSYARELCGEVVERFGGRLPVLVGAIGPSGRARDWMERAPAAQSLDLAPCAMAAWPVVDFQGRVVACCNQDVVDGPPPPHLLLGSALEHGWGALRRRLEQRILLRALRLMGPHHIDARWGRGAELPAGYCERCRCLGLDKTAEERLEAELARPLWRLLEGQILEALADPSTLPLPGFEPYVTLGRAP